MSTHKIVPIQNSQLLRGGNYFAIWHLREFNFPYNLDLFPLDNGCMMECTERIKLRFHMKRHHEQLAPGKTSDWLSLCVTVEKTPKYPLWFYLLIHKLDTTLTAQGYFNDNSQWKGIIVASPSEAQGKVIFPHFINISTTTCDESGKYTTTYFPHETNYLLYMQVEINPKQHGDLNITMEANSLVRTTSESLLCLPREFLEIYNSETNMSDIQLELNDGIILNAHRIILAARSPYLRTILENDKTCKTLKIDDVSGKTMKVLIHWMYSGELKLNELKDQPCEVVSVASKFNILELLKRLDVELIVCCTKSNAFDLLEIAKKHNLNAAISNIEVFISTHFSE